MPRLILRERRLARVAGWGVHQGFMAATGMNATGKVVLRSARLIVTWVIFWYHLRVLIGTGDRRLSLAVSSRVTEFDRLT